MQAMGRVSTQFDAVAIEKRQQDGILRPLGSNRVTQEGDALPPKMDTSRSTSSLGGSGAIQPSASHTHQELRPLEQDRIKQDRHVPTNLATDSPLGTCTIQPGTPDTYQELRPLKQGRIKQDRGVPQEFPIPETTPSTDSTLGTCTVELAVEPTCNSSASITLGSDNPTHALDGGLTKCRVLEEKHVMQKQPVDELSNSFETRDNISTDICNRLSGIVVQPEQLNTMCALFEELSSRLLAIEEQQERLNSTKCTLLEKNEAIPSDLSNRLQALEEQQQRFDSFCIIQEANSSDLCKRLGAIEEAVAAQRTNFQSHFAALQDNQTVLLELRHEFRMQQEKQELQAEKIVTVASDLDKLLSNTQLDHELKDLQAWTAQQVENLNSEFGEIRGSVERCLPLGALMRETQSSIREHQQQFQHGLEQLRQKMTCGSERIEMLESRVKEMLESKVNDLQGEVRSISQADSIAFTTINNGTVDCVRNLTGQQNAQTSTNKIDMTHILDPIERSQVACPDAELDSLRSALNEQASIQLHASKWSVISEADLIASKTIDVGTIECMQNLVGQQDAQHRLTRLTRH